LAWGCVGEVHPSLYRGGGESKTIKFRIIDEIKI
jgi:hypothetical protein